jgi:protein-disulfide isomerase
MRVAFDRLVTGVLVVCALVMTSAVVKREFFAPPRRGAPRKPTPVDGWKELAAAGHRLGSPNAPITLTVFSGFQCPYCKRFDLVMAQVLSKYPDDVSVSSVISRLS